MYDALPNLPFIMKREVIDIVSGVEDENNLISKFSLEQNYPNPFNPSTNIQSMSFRAKRGNLVYIKSL